MTSSSPLDGAPILKNGQKDRARKKGGDPHDLWCAILMISGATGWNRCSRWSMLTSSDAVGSCDLVTGRYFCVLVRKWTPKHFESYLPIKPCGPTHDFGVLVSSLNLGPTPVSNSRTWPNLTWLYLKFGGSLDIIPTVPPAPCSRKMPTNRLMLRGWRFFSSNAPTILICGTFLTMLLISASRTCSTASTKITLASPHNFSAKGPGCIAGHHQGTDLGSEIAQAPRTCEGDPSAELTT